MSRSQIDNLWHTISQSPGYNASRLLSDQQIVESYGLEYLLNLEKYYQRRIARTDYQEFHEALDLIQQLIVYADVQQFVNRTLASVN
jgi:hypothetical protein